MKITVKKINLNEVAGYRERLAALLEEGTNGSAEYARLTESREKFATEIARLEAIDEPSEEDAGKLAAKRTQLERVTGRLQTLDEASAATDVEFNARALELLRPFARAAAAATGPSVQAYMDTVAAAVRPFCQDTATAQAVARQTPAVISLISATTRPWGSYGVSPQELKGAIAMADAILAGEIAWTWDAKV